MLNEIRILKQVNHPNIVKLYSVIETEKEVCLLMEHVQGEPMNCYINRIPGKKLGEDGSKHFFR